MDLPAADGEPSGRLYLAGDEVAYQKGSVLGELRDPFLKVRVVPLCMQADVMLCAMHAVLLHAVCCHWVVVLVGMSSGCALSCPLGGAWRCINTRGFVNNML